MSDQPATPAPETGAPRQKARAALLTIDLDRLPGAAVAAGVALLSAAVVVATLHSRPDGDLDASNFIMGVLAALGLLGVAAGAQLLIPEAERRAALVSWPGAAGAIGAGLMVGVLINDDSWSAYVASVLVIALSALGYRLSAAAPFVLSAIAGLALLYAKAFDDIFDLGGGGNNVFMSVGAGILVFVVAVTAAGWMLPATRVLSGVVVGAAGLAGMTLVLEVAAVLSLISGFGFGFGTTSDDAAPQGFGIGPAAFLEGRSHHDPYRNDVSMVLLYCVVLAALWAVAALATGHVGFRILLVADAVVIVPLAIYALRAGRPTWWEVVCAGIGGVLLLGAGWLVRPRSAVPAAPSAPAAPGPPPTQ